MIAFPRSALIQSRPHRRIPLVWVTKTALLVPLNRSRGAVAEKMTNLPHLISHDVRTSLCASLLPFESLTPPSLRRTAVHLFLSVTSSG